MSQIQFLLSGNGDLAITADDLGSAIEQVQGFLTEHNPEQYCIWMNKCYRSKETT